MIWGCLGLLAVFALLAALSQRGKTQALQAVDDRRADAQTRALLDEVRREKAAGSKTDSVRDS